MYVYICFDVEDLVCPDADDPALDIAEALGDDGVTASLCVVGEKARLWERRGRWDVIAAAKRHDISLHTNLHSMHPVVGEYLADKGWADGVAEAVRQEGPGARDLTRIFGRPPTSWGTPGSSWSAQIPAATRRLGIPSNIYSGAHSGQTGACWYAGQLCFSEYTYFPGGEDALCDDAGFEAALPSLLQQLSEARDQGYACYGLFAAHPNRLRHTIFWDAVNFVQGYQTPPEEYKLVPRRDLTAYARGIKNLRRMVAAIRGLPGIEIVGVGPLAERFQSGEGELTRAQLHDLARKIVDTGAISMEEPLASPAQTLDALLRASVQLADGWPVSRPVSLRTVLGPAELPPVLEHTVSISAQQGLYVAQDLVSRIGATGQLPTSVQLGGAQVGPGPLLRAVAAAYLMLEGGREPSRLDLEPGAEEPARAAELADWRIEQLRGWPPHPLDLPLDRMKLQTRLQYWSARPAQLRAS